METENLKVIGLDVIVNRFFGEDEDSKKFIIDRAEVHFDTHDLRSGFALYTLVSRIDFLEFLQNMVDTIGDCDLARTFWHKFLSYQSEFLQEQIDLLREDIPVGVYINLEV